MGRPSRSFLHALGSHPSYLLRSLHCAFALFALFSNELRLPADEFALNLEQVLRTPGLDDLKREVEVVGDRRFGKRQQPSADFGLLLNTIKSIARRRERAFPTWSYSDLGIGRSCAASIPFPAWRSHSADWNLP
jgi:hypothetical protein